MSNERPDANRIALRAARSVLAAAASTKIVVEGTPVDVRAERLPAAPWPARGLVGLDETVDGPLPSSVQLSCTWPGGGTDLILAVRWWQTKGPNRHLVGLRLSVAETNQELIWTTVALPLRDGDDGETIAIPAAFSPFKRPNEDGKADLERKERLQAVVHRSGLRLLSPWKILAFSVRLPEGTVLPSPEDGYRVLLHLGLLKLPFWLRGEQGLEGAPPFDVTAVAPLPTAERDRPDLRSEEPSSPLDPDAEPGGDMLRYLKLHGVGPAPEMELQFSERLNVLTGDNGLGKSFLLEIAWWALTRTWAGSTALPRTDAEDPTITFIVRGKAGDTEPMAVPYDFHAQGWPAPRNRPPMPGIVIYARVDGGFAVWDPARTSRGHAPTKSIRDPDRPSELSFDDHALWHGLTLGDRRPCEGLIRDWVSWQKGREPEFDLLMKVLEALSLPDEPLVAEAPRRVSIDDGYDVPTVRTRYGIVPLTHASAGLRRIVGLAYLLVWAWREHGLVSKLLRRPPEQRLVLLVDEPETHLHPKWQRLIVPALLRAAGVLRDGLSVEPQIIVATHSPLVLASLEPVFDEEKDSLFDLALETDPEGRTEVLVRRPPWRRRGDVSAWLTSDVFDLGSARSLEAEQATGAALAILRRSPSPPLDEIEEVDRALRGVLGEMDPFWVRWSAYVEKRKGAP
jgi:hypothetical protein